MLVALKELLNVMLCPVLMLVHLTCAYTLIRDTEMWEASFCVLLSVVMYLYVLDRTSLLFS